MGLTALVLSPADLASDLPPEVLFIMVGIFASAGWFFISPYLLDRVRPKKPLVFDPYRKGRKLILNIVIASIFIGSFLYTFHLIPLGKDAAEMIYLLYFFDVLMASLLLSRLFGAMKLLRQANRFGKSYLKLGETVPYRLGSQLRFQVFNERLLREGQYSEVYFRNIQESWDVGGTKKKEGKNSSGLVTEIVYEEQQSILLGLEHDLISFRIPEWGSPTQYVNPNPIYWEIMIINKSLRYEARFFITVA